MSLQQYLALWRWESEHTFIKKHTNEPGLCKEKFIFHQIRGLPSYSRSPLTKLHHGCLNSQHVYFVNWAICASRQSDRRPQKSPDDWQEIRTLRSVYLPLNPSKLAQQAIIYPIGRQTGKVPAVLKVNFASVVNKKNTKVQHGNLRMISKNSFTLARNKWGTTF